MRFLFLLRRGGFRSFKRLRMGIRLLRQGIATVIFHHQKYVWFCLGIVGIQLARMYATTLINPQFSITNAITESLMGRNFFDILFDRVGALRIAVILAEVSFFYLEQFCIFAIASAVSYYTLIQSTIVYSASVSLTKWKRLSIWTALNCIVLFTSAALGGIGDIAEFIWLLSTALVIPFITFKPYSVITIIKDAFKAFKERMSLFIGAEVSLEFILTIFTLVFYVVYSGQTTQTFQFLQPRNFSLLTLSSIAYLNAVVIITEATTLALVYQALMVPEYKQLPKQ